MYFSDETTHIFNTQCVLCRQPAQAGGLILDPDGIQYAANICNHTCHLCSLPTPHMWFHQSCYDLLMESYPPDERPNLSELEDFGDATKDISKPLINYTFNPASIQEGLLSKTLQGTLDGSFRQELIAKLPVEVLLIIIEFIGPCGYLIVLGETRRLLENLRGREVAGHGVLSLSKDLYITRLEYQGMSYISSISNSPPRLESQEYLRPPGNVRQILLLATHVGIHKIHFGDATSNLVPDDVVSPADGIWYELIDAQQPCEYLEVVHHALFLRSCQLRSSNSGAFDLNTIQKWDIPRIPNIPQANFFRLRKETLYSYMSLDYSRLMGLVVCCFEGSNIGLFPLPDIANSYSKVLSKIKGIDERRGVAYWMFFPISYGEHIKRAWVRKTRSRFSEPTLALQTTRDRWALFGLYPEPTVSRYSYHMISLTSETDGPISGFCHDGLDPDHWEISGYGVTCSLSLSTTAMSTSLADPTWYPYAPPTVPRKVEYHSWYMTRAPLSGLVKVQTCKSVGRSFTRCLGLLLHYEDGSVESLGQFRWDQIISQPIPIPIRIQSGRLGPWKKHSRYVLDVRSVSDLGSVAKWGRWDNIPDYGYLVWWFGRLGDRLVTHSR